MRRLWVAIFVVGLLPLQGCASIALTAASTAAGMGVDHTLNGITFKTVVSPVADLRLAMLKTLSRMDIEVTEDKETPTGWEIAGTANDRTIEVELEAVTDKVTRMRVVANKGTWFFKDSATATEIILQTLRVLEEDAEYAVAG